jgi:hypothetical protein
MHVGDTLVGAMLGMALLSLVGYYYDKVTGKSHLNFECYYCTTEGEEIDLCTWTPFNGGGHLHQLEKCSEITINTAELPPGSTLRVWTPPAVTGKGTRWQ